MGIRTFFDRMSGSVKKSPPSEGVMPVMSPEEVDCYADLLSQSETVVEYGIGGSTLMALKETGVKKLVSVESDPLFVASMKEDPLIDSCIARGIATILYVDIGKTRDWGIPVGKEKADQWFNYPAAPWEHVERADLVLVDGRFRVACVIEAALRAQPDTLIAVHDFWDRPEYHVVLPFLEWQQSSGRFGVFRRRPDLDTTRAKSLLNDARHWWR